MIPALIIWLIKKYGSSTMLTKIDHTIKLVKKYAITPIFFTLLLCCPANTNAQEINSNYNIFHNGKIIGNMQFNQKTNGEDVYLKMSSKVQTRFVFGINVTTLDQSHFKAGKLIYSNVFRTVNGKEKDCKKTKLINDSYQILTGNKQQHIKGSISYNMSLLYGQEPVNINTIYSDNFQQFLSIRKIANNKYRIDLPDGNYNEYLFKNGICSQVTVHHSLYTIEMKLIA